ncbi:MAG: cytidylate kinase-like family protein [Armatimonadetes bacterium]|nr:cytidylate kinase-like family protein [Armatimonadota bacterium]
MGRLHHLEARSLARWNVDRRVAERFWRDEQRRPVRGDLITISRQAGSGGKTIARIVAAELGYTVYDKEIIDKLADLLGTDPRKVERVDEQAPPMVIEILQAALDRTPSSASYLRRLREVTKQIAARGKAIILGRGGACLLPESLRVRVVAPFETRVARVAELQGLSESDARRLVAESDAARKAFGRRHFRCDIDDPALYDLTINTERISLEHAAEMIITAVERWQSDEAKPHTARDEE